jgi:hypothetical protein
MQVADDRAQSVREGVTTESTMQHTDEWVLRSSTEQGDHNTDVWSSTAADDFAARVKCLSRRCKEQRAATTGQGLVKSSRAIAGVTRVAPARQQNMFHSASHIVTQP